MNRPNPRRKSKSVLTYCLALTCSWAGGQVRAAPASKKDRVRLFQRLHDGRLLRYQFGAETATMVTTPSLTQTQRVSRRDGQWTVYFLSGDEQLDYKTAQQLELGPGRMASVERNGRPVDLDDPRVKAVSLPSAACQFLAESVTRTQMPIVLPAGNPLERLIYRIVMDQFQFSSEAVSLRTLKKSKIDWHGFSGERFWMLTDIQTVGKKRIAVAAIQIQGEFTGNMPGDPKLRDAKITLRWDLANQAMLDLVGEVRYDRQFDRVKEEVSTRLAMVRQHLDRLEPALREPAVEELLHLADAINTYQKKGYAEVGQRVAAFARDYGKSPWLPMARFLGRQAQARLALTSPGSKQRLRKALGMSIVEWQTATSQNDTAKLTELADGLRELNRAGRSGLIKMVRDKDPKVRALALFALGFGIRPDDLRYIEKGAGDADSVARAWAAYGLVIRGSPDTDSALLERLIGDKSDQVRARGALAIGACVAVDSPERRRFRELLTTALADTSEKVRRAAAEALSAIGTRADLPALRKALKVEGDSAARQMMSRTMGQIERR